MFSRQYHINCLSIQKHVQFHICIYFRYLAVCITLIVKPTCIYFRFSAVCITLIAKFLSTLLHLAGFILMRFCWNLKTLIYYCNSSWIIIYNLSIIFLSSIYHLSNIFLSSIYPQSIYRLPIFYLLSIYHLSIIHLSSIYLLML